MKKAKELVDDDDAYNAYNEAAALISKIQDKRLRDWLSACLTDYYNNKASTRPNNTPDNTVLNTTPDNTVANVAIAGVNAPVPL